jgi:hypothetical protein
VETGEEVKVEEPVNLQTDQQAPEINFDYLLKCVVDNVDGTSQEKQRENRDNSFEIGGI